MGEVRPVAPVKLVCGIIAVRGRVLGEAQAALSERFGPVDLESDCVSFDFTDYYRAEMGPGLIRKFLSFAQPIAPFELAGIKRAALALEDRFAVQDRDTRRRRVNLDPGYLAADKLVLATTKDFAHRMCIGNGIYAEVTLQFSRGRCVCREWTYPDFRSGAYDEFLLRVRRAYLAARPG